MTQDSNKPGPPDQGLDPAEPSDNAGVDESPASGDDRARDKRAGPERKERVLHTRVPAVLEQELKRLATNLRMPVSNVVRAILEDAVTAVDLVGRKAEGEMQSVVDRLSAQRERLRNIATGGTKSAGVDDEPQPAREDDQPANAEVTSRAASRADVLAGVIGFQPLVLAAAASCALCGKSLAVGQQAFLGVHEGTGPRVLIGNECLPKHQSDDKEIEP